jgi:hypothetical protein
MRDTVSLSSSASIPMTFALATRVAGSSFARSARSGVLGLGQDAMSTMPISESELETSGATLFSRLVRAKAIPQSLMSLRLDKGRQSQGVVVEEGAGQYTFGGIEDQCELLVRQPPDRADIRGVAMSDMSVGTTSIFAVDTDTPRRAIVDSGVSRLD